MKIPIIFINKGQSYYLNYALKAAQRTNPDTEIILITDNPKGIPRCIKVEDINKYNQKANEWAKTYKHTSKSTGKEIERFCFERWFILNEYLRKNNIKETLTLDSDVLLYTNINEDYEKYWKYYPISIANGKSGGFAFIDNINTIEIICKLIENNPDYSNDTEPFKQYSKDCKVGNICENLEGEYDAAINEKQGKKMFRGMKQIEFIGKIPYAINEKTNNKVKMKSLHLQGMHKFYMKPFYNYNSNKRAMLKAEMMGNIRNKISPLIGTKTRNTLKRIVQRI